MQGDSLIFLEILKAIDLCHEAGVFKFNFDRYNIRGLTPLHIACIKKFSKIEYHLLKVGAKVSVNNLAQD